MTNRRGGEGEGDWAGADAARNARTRTPPATFMRTSLRWKRAASAPRKIVPIDGPALHDEAHALHGRDVRHRIAGRGHEVRELALLDGADAVGPAEDLRVDARGRHQR